MRLMPERNMASSSGLQMAGVVRKCSEAQVRVSEDVNFLPMTWAPDDANFMMLLSLSALRWNVSGTSRPRT